MFISNVTNQGLSTAVWANATRTLTADPATDAGAATLVWTHATRTLTADPATDAGAATLVWGHATRTLTADPFTDAVGGAAVWSHANRNLVLMGFAANASTIDNPVAANTTIDLRPAAGKIRYMLVVVVAASGGAMTINAYDGTTSRIVKSVAASATDSFYTVATSNVGIRITNTDGTNQGRYMVLAADYSL